MNDKIKRGRKRLPRGQRKEFKTVQIIAPPDDVYKRIINELSPEERLEAMEKALAAKDRKAKRGAGQADE